MFRPTAIIVCFLLPFLSLAQADSSRLRVSLLTVSPGDEIYAAFGHTGIRITDSASGRDIVYNYGTFAGFDDNFELNFARGKLLYSISSESFPHFIQTYIHEERTVQEQELFMTGVQKKELWEFLRWNERPENRSYKYDFFYDNCATRIRDVFSNIFGKGFAYGQTISPGSKVTFRQQINAYLRGQHWERFGINLVLGSRIDKVMSNKDVMFLPDYLRDGIGGATLNGQKVATPPVTLLQMPGLPSPGPDIPFLLLLAISAVTIAGLAIPRLALIGKIMSNVLLVVSGLLGIFLLVMWFGTDHQACRYNWNILWALPTNLLVPVIRKNGRSRYAVIAIALILVTLVLHVTGLQEIALYELWPLLLALLLIFGMIYRQGKQMNDTYAAS